MTSTEFSILISSGISVTLFTIGVIVALSRSVGKVEGVQQGGKAKQTLADSNPISHELMELGQSQTKILSEVAATRQDVATTRQELADYIKYSKEACQMRHDNVGMEINHLREMVTGSGRRPG